MILIAITSSCANPVVRGYPAGRESGAWLESRNGLGAGAQYHYAGECRTKSFAVFCRLFLAQQHSYSVAENALLTLVVLLSSANEPFASAGCIVKERYNKRAPLTEAGSIQIDNNV
jgi:hypothetical protein